MLNTRDTNRLIDLDRSFKILKMKCHLSEHVFTQEERRKLVAASWEIERIMINKLAESRRK